jgi:hypothetical protein
MSQLVVVQSADRSALERVCRRLLSLFDSHCGLKPADLLLSHHAAAVTFPRTRKNGMPIARSADTWVGVAGTVFWQGKSPAETLGELASGWNPLGVDGVARDLKETEGSFVLAAGDCSPEGGVVVATDRLGTLHAYAAESDSCAVVSTSSLVLGAWLQPGWHPESCREFLSTGTVFGQRSLFARIEKLGPAQIFGLRNGRLIQRSRYWNLPDVMAQRQADRNPIPAIAEALRSSLEIITRSFPNPLFDLTGGFDSRAVTGAMLKVKPGFSTVVVGSPDDADVLVAAEIAAAMGLRHQRVEDVRADMESLTRALPLCDGECNLFEYSRTMRVHQALAPQYDASVNGSNGEIAKGYWWELLFPHTGSCGHFDEKKLAAERFAKEMDSTELLSMNFDASLTDHFAGLIREAGRDFEHLPNTARMDNIYLTLRMQQWQGRIASATSRIWPCLSPFMWRRPMELILATPPRVRVRHRLSRRLIEYLNPELAGIPLDKGYPALPLRLSTAYRFGPLVCEIAGKLAKRILGASAHASGAPPIAVRKTGIDEDVRDLMQPGRMLTSDLYRKNRLAEVVKSPTTKNEFLQRMITLELLARSLRDLQPR